MSYVPPQAILDKYAKVLINFALWSGGGIKPGDTVYLLSPTSALPFYRALEKAIIDSGGNIISGLNDDMGGMTRYFLENASEKQLSKFTDKYYKGLADEIDHRVVVLADHDVHKLDGVSPKRMLLRQKSRKPLADWLNQKENDGKYTWTLALYGTESMAKEAGLSIREYWRQIIKANFLDSNDPISEWRKISDEVQRVAETLSNLPITSLHVQGEDADLHISLGEKRRWLGGSGRNIPSFEVFTSPDWRGTEGWVRFNQPLYNYGPRIEGIELTFKKGRVIKSSATQNENLLKEMLATDEGASQMGEFSLTDKRLSRITKFMAHTLFDENMGGKFGNTHLAVGKSYHETFAGDTKGVAKDYFKKLGFNESAIHNDMISTTDRTVAATMKDGSQKVIYEKGQFSV